MENNKQVPQLSQGIFLTKDIANILSLPYAKVRSGMAEFWDDYTFGEKGNLAVNFYTLIEFYTFYQLREKGISSQMIKKAHQKIAKELNTLYPFARNIHTDGREIWYEFLENIVNADGKQQISIKPILLPFLTKIEFNKDDIADRYFPLSKSRQVVVDPKYQFGQPTITGTGIKVETIAQLYKGGESPQNIAALYNLKPNQVKDAIAYYKQSA